tara:strand:+ start:454 stop:651 length:198 start_codon:yes stop_codon:yes gene_type:complete
MKTKTITKVSKKSKIVDKLAKAANLDKDTITIIPPMIVINDEIERRAAEAGFSDEQLKYKYLRNV